MNAALILAVAVGGAAGAPLRMFIDGRVTGWVERHRRSGNLSMFPWGLLAVNVFGSLIIGIAFGALDGPLRTLVATGVCGALTTYSSYALVVHNLWHKNRRLAWASVIVMPVASIAVCSLAIVATRAFI